MMNIKNFVELQQKLSVLDSYRRKCEDEQITAILKFFQIPEYKNDGARKTIEEYLQDDTIVIFIPKNEYCKIDFDKISLPPKIRLQINHVEDSWFVMGYKEPFRHEPILSLSTEPYSIKIK